jgi:glycerol kinase
MLFNIHDRCWDKEMLKLFNIPESMLPEVCGSSELYAETSGATLGFSVPVAGIAGDQQAALFGQMCTEPGMLKNTYGTGCFMILNTGETPVKSENNLLTTVAWQIDNQVTYSLEGSIFIAGAAVQWLRDGLGIIKTSEQVEELARSVPDNGGIYLVPAFAGLGAPHWDQFARGAILGLTRGTTAGHLARAALEGIAFQTMDVLSAMQADSGMPVSELRVDGGAAANNTLMQFQADILNVPIARPKVLETTALGAAYLAGLAVGFWNSIDEIKVQWQIERLFKPDMVSAQTDILKKNWRKALQRSKDWIEN